MRLLLGFAALFLAISPSCNTTPPKPSPTQPAIDQTPVDLTTVCGKVPSWTKKGITTYHLPAWVKTLNWVSPADTIWGGTATKPTTVDDSANRFRSIFTRRDQASQIFCNWISVEGGKPPYSYSGSGLPPGLKVQTVGSYAIYGGKATTPGSYSVTLCATDSAGTQVCIVPRRQDVCTAGKTACGND